MPQDQQNRITRLLLGSAIASLMVGCGSESNLSDSIAKAEPSPAVSSTMASSTSVSDTSSSVAAFEPDFINPDTGLGVVVIITAVDASLEADGSTQLKVSFVDENGVAVAVQGTHSLASVCLDESGKSIATFNESESTADVFVYDYATSGCPTEDVVTVSGEWLEASGLTYSADVGLVIAETVGSVNFASATPSVLAVIGAGGADTSTVTFDLRSNITGSPLVDELVEFEVAAGTGIDLSTPQVRTNAEGQAVVLVSAGAIPGAYRIRATHLATGLSSLSDDIVVNTGLPVADKISFTAVPSNPNLFVYNDGEKVTLTVVATDKTGVPVSDGTTVSFINTESGRLSSGSCELVGGECSVDWLPTASKPADGRVTVAVELNVQEGFEDVNNNYIFDDGDIFDLELHDLPDSYVDENENGGYDVGEFVSDTNGNGLRDLGNGLWNGNGCQHSTLCDEGNQAVKYSSSLTLYLAKDDDITFCAGMAEGDDFYTADDEPIELAADDLATLEGLIISDGNINAINEGVMVGSCGTGNSLPAGTKVEFSIDEGELKGEKSWTVPPSATDFWNMPYEIRIATPVVAVDTKALLTLKITTPANSGQDPKEDYTFMEVLIKP